jgi:predicted signal transduction protein with EAL and GGDEF domain
MPEMLPDVVLIIRRDGVLLEHIAGHGVFDLDPALQAAWPESVAQQMKQLVRRVIASRATEEMTFHHERTFQVRATAQGPDRAICVIRPLAADADAKSASAADQPELPQFDRRGFLRRFKASMSAAALREKPTAVAVIRIDGIAEIARAIGNMVSEQVSAIAVQRLLQTTGSVADDPAWYAGQLSEGTIAVVLETTDRDAIERCIARACQALREPIKLGDATFHLSTYAGAAILGRDSASPKSLLDHARSAASEARRAGATALHFFSDTLKLRSLARLDIAHELSQAISSRAIRLHYVGRHDLTTGRLVTKVGYLRWLHPLRGEVRPLEFLSVAEATGQAQALSRCALECLREDLGAEVPRAAADVRLSFGALRHHVMHAAFVQDIAAFIAENAIPAERLELRISERCFVAREPAEFLPLKELGVHLVVDEVGRGLTSLDRLARAALWGLQLDRSWASAVHKDPVALKVCRAGMSVASALGLTPIATGVDNLAQCRALLALGCRQGMGDLYLKQKPLVSSAAI